MSLSSHIDAWKGSEIAAFCGPIKYRGELIEVLDDQYLIMKNVAVMNPGSQETAEYQNCVLNIAEVSGIVSEEIMGRGPEGEVV